MPDACIKLQSLAATMVGGSCRRQNGIQLRRWFVHPCGVAGAGAGAEGLLDPLSSRISLVLIGTGAAKAGEMRRRTRADTKAEVRIVAGLVVLGEEYIRRRTLFWRRIDEVGDLI